MMNANSHWYIQASAYYLTRVPWGGMQDDPGAKSADWLCGYKAMHVAEFSTSFSILCSQR